MTLLAGFQLLTYGMALWIGLYLLANDVGRRRLLHAGSALLVVSGAVAASAVWDDTLALQWATGLVTLAASLWTGGMVMLLPINRSPMEMPPPSPAGANLMRFLLGLAGAIMLGWAISLAGIAHYAFRRGERWAWLLIAFSVLSWFLVDSAVSIATGLYANVVGNIVFLILFEIPLVATYNKIVRWPIRENEVPA